MKAKIEGVTGTANVELIPGKGGVFEVKINGKLVYSKKETGEFPEETEILKLF